jgi:serine/threonine protein kinase
LFIGTVYKAKLIPVGEFYQEFSPIPAKRVINISFIQTSQSRPSSAACARPNFYAIKCINRKSLTKTTQDLLINEIKLLKHIKHDNIVEMYDFQVNKFVFVLFEILFFIFQVG